MRAQSRHSHRSLKTALAIAIAAIALPISLAAASTDAPFAVQLVRVNVPTQADRDRLTNVGVDLTEHGGLTYVEAVLHNAADAGRLLSAGFTWTVTIPDLGLREIQNNKVNAAYAADTAVSPLPSGRDTYRTLANYNDELRGLAASNPEPRPAHHAQPQDGGGARHPRRRDLRQRQGDERRQADLPDHGPASRARVALGRERDGVRPRPDQEQRQELAHHRACSRRRASSSSRSSTPTASSSRASGATSSTSARSTTAARSRSSATPATRTSARTAASSTARARRRAAASRRARAATASAST